MLAFDDITKLIEPEQKDLANSVLTDDLSGLSTESVQVPENLASIRDFTDDTLPSSIQTELSARSESDELTQVLNRINRSLDSIANRPDKNTTERQIGVLQPASFDNASNFTSNISSISNSSIVNNKSFEDSIESLESSVNNFNSNIKNSETRNIRSGDDTDSITHEKTFVNSIDDLSSVLNKNDSVLSQFLENNSKNDEIQSMFSTFASSTSTSNINDRANDLGLALNPTGLQSTVNDISSSDEEIDQSVINNIVNSNSKHQSTFNDLSSSISSAIASTLAQNNETLISALSQTSARESSHSNSSETNRIETNSSNTVQNHVDQTPNEQQTLRVLMHYMQQIVDTLQGGIKIKNSAW